MKEVDYLSHSRVSDRFHAAPAKSLSRKSGGREGIQSPDRYLGFELRRILHSDCHDGSTEVVPRRRGCSRRRRLRNVLLRSLSWRLDGKPYRHAGAESEGLCECFPAIAYRSAGAPIARAS